MADTTNTLPEQIIKTSQAFTQSLEMENTVFQGQLNGAIEMTVHAFGELITLCKEAIAVGNTGTAKGKQNLADKAQQALADVKNAAGKANGAPEALTPVEAVLDSAVLQALALSYQNAVTAQQQTYIVQQAAATQIIATILSVATATLGKAVAVVEGVKDF
jgi:hypothetical protein